MTVHSDTEAVEAHWDAVEERVNDALRLPHRVSDCDPDPYDFRHDVMVGMTRREEAHHGGPYDLEGRGL